MTKLRNGKYTHLILDIILPDGNTLEIIPAIKQLYPDLQILILSMQPQEVYSLAMNHYAINYYVSKGSAENEILTSFKKFFDNKPLESNVRARAHSQTNNPFIELTPRELEVLHYLLRGENTKDISSVLNLKMNTVSTFKNRIFGKTNTSNIRELLEKASLYNMRF